MTERERETDRQIDRERERQKEREIKEGKSLKIFIARS